MLIAANKRTLVECASIFRDIRSVCRACHIFFSNSGVPGHGAGNNYAAAR